MFALLGGVPGIPELMLILLVIVVNVALIVVAVRLVQGALQFKRGYSEAAEDADSR